MPKNSTKFRLFIFTLLLFSFLQIPHAFAGKASPVKAVKSGEALYKKLVLLVSKGKEASALFATLAKTGQSLDWKKAQKKKFTGNTRLLKSTETKGGSLYLIRELNGVIHVLVLPKDKSARSKKSKSFYAEIASTVKHKMEFQGITVSMKVAGEQYSFMKLTAKPVRNLLDRLFFISIVLMLFLTMVGMGLTLTIEDFAIVFKKPLGMIVGPLCQFGLLPLLAMVIGKVSGLYESFPFIYLGLILIAATPGGVTSNLMTYFGKGDVALSISLTALCTMLSIIFTPLLLTLYVSGIPEFTIPVMDVFKTMMVLVIVPLFVGMVIRAKAEKFAKKAEKPFAILGVFALLFLIVVGVWTNADKFADTKTYGIKFYIVVFILTFAGMVVSALIAKLVRVTNFQTRAISLEVGLRNASLAMTIAILLQDQIGDFSSSMFFTSGVFGLWMYVAGILTIYLFPKVLPLKETEAKSEA